MFINDIRHIIALHSKIINTFLSSLPNCTNVLHWVKRFKRWKTRTSSRIARRSLMTSARLAKIRVPFSRNRRSHPENTSRGSDKGMFRRIQHRFTKLSIPLCFLFFFSNCNFNNIEASILILQRKVKKCWIFQTYYESVEVCVAETSPN